MSSPSATFAVWSSAWLNGAAAADDVLDALQDWAQMHEVVAADDATAAALDLPVDGKVPAQHAVLLAALRRSGSTGARLVMPVPGDVRGLGGPGEFALEALRLGSAAVFGDVGLGVVTEIVAEEIARWTVFRLPELPRFDHVSIADAEHGLTTATRAAASALAELDVARDRANVRTEIRDRAKLSTKGQWPAGMPPRSLRVLQRAGELSAILDVAAEDEPGGALSASAAARRTEALRPLVEAVRIARCAAVEEALRVFSEHADRH